MNFQAPRSLEKGLSTQLKKVSAEILKICGSGADEQTIIFSLRNYAGKLGPWATKVMLDTVIKSNQRNEQAWRMMSKVLSEEIKNVYTQSAVSQTIADLSREGARLISSLPSECAQDIAEAAAQWAAQTGRRYTSIQEEIYHLGQITEARAELIARTEVARQQSLLTQTRAVSIGSKGYIWRTADDGRVRPGHAALNGQYIEWDKPPECDPGYHAHAGQIFNCRCWPEPVVGENPGAVTPPGGAPVTPPVTPQTTPTPVQIEIEQPAVVSIKETTPTTMADRLDAFKGAGSNAAIPAEAFKDARPDVIKAYQNYCESSDMRFDAPYSRCLPDGTVELTRTWQADGLQRLEPKYPDLDIFNGSNGTIRHEYGHSLDFKIARKQGLWYGSGFSEQDPAFCKACRNTAKALRHDDALRIKLGVNDFGPGNAWLKGRYAYFAPVSDIVDGLTKGDISGNFGHRKSYWRTKGHTEAEVFADLMNIYASGSQSDWADVAGLFPELAAVFEDIIKKAATGGF